MWNNNKLTSPKLYLLKMISNSMKEDQLKCNSRQNLYNEQLRDSRNFDQRVSTYDNMIKPRNVSELSMMGRKSVSFFSGRVRRGAAGIGVSEYNHKSNGLII